MQKKKTILLVEDSRLMRKFVTDLLHQNGYEAKSALSGEDALQIISGGFLPDLILMDIELPGKIDGMEATRIITELCDIPVVFLTANTSPEITAKVREVNAYGFVLKGTDKAALLSTIDMALKLHKESVRSGMFERLFEISNDELYVFQPDSLNLVAVNKSAQKSLDYQPEELKSLTLMDINPELDAQKFKDTLKLLHDGKIEQVEMETLHRKKSGALYPVKLSLRLFNYEGKNYCLAMGSNLTSKKKLEIGLKEKEELINAIVNAAQDAIIMLDNDGCVTFWNPAAEKIFGYSKEEMLGKDLHRLVMPDPGFYNPYRDTFRHFIETGESDIIGKTLEIKARHKCGREIDVELSVSALKLEGVWHTVGIVRDISQRKKLQEELESSLKEYMDLAENAPIGITKCDSEGYVNYVNPKTMEILGPNSLDAVKRFNIFTAPELCQHEFSKKLKDCMDLNKADICEMGYEPLQGKKTWLRIHINPLQGKRTVRGAQIIIDDITEKKQLEEKNRKAAEKMRLIIEGMPNPAWLVSKKRKILAQNKAAETLFGTKIGESCHESGTDNLSLPDFCHGEEALSHKMPINEVLQIEGRFWDIWWVPLEDNVYLHYAVDVTKFKKMEEELYRLATTDSSLNIFNRRYFIQELEKEMERAKRAGCNFSVIMMDIDHFKDVNDRFGHNAGDLVLKIMTETIRNRIRKIDVLARWGGEEFIILLPETDVESAAKLAEDLRKKVNELDIPEVGRITASFGIACYCEDDTVDSLVKRADDMMYEAKTMGRNCVRYSSLQSPQ